MRWGLLIVVGLLLVAGGVMLALRGGKTPASSGQTEATAPATKATTTVSVPAPPPTKPKDYMDVVRIHYPDFPTTQPLMVPVAMSEAARLVVQDPIYLDLNGELWITRADAESSPVVFKSVQECSTHVVRDNVVYVHRWPDDRGVWQPQLICRKPAGGYELVTRLARQDLTGTYNYQWHRAFSWNEAIVVPTDRGISIFRPDRQPMEMYHEFIPADQFDPAKYSQVEVLLDWRGLMAWMPWESYKLGSHGAARFLNNKWTALDASANWPDKILHLVPLLDGCILQLAVGEANKIDVAMAALDVAEVDTKKSESLIQQLSDLDAEKRTAAFNELTRYGSGIWTILEKNQANQPPEAQFRLQQLLNAKTQPTLGGMTLQPGPVKVIARGDYGGAILLYSDAGVSIPRVGEDTPQMVSPAWINIEPGRPIMLAPQLLSEELKPKGRELRIVRGEYIVNDSVTGPRWWLSNSWSAPLLKGKDLEYRQLIGQDGRGRWLFRKTITDLSPTLIIDPTLPDPAPRLPVWVYRVEGGEVGWNQDNWPAIKSGGAWALVENDWHAIDESKEKFNTTITTTPATAPTSAPGLQAPILVESDGTRFYDGKETLRMRTSADKEVAWPLPPEAVGSADPVLLRAGEDRLFLINGPGRVLRIRPTLSGTEPFILEATFTHNIPNVDAPARIWLDPAGRIIFAYDGNKLAICFPTGRIPSDIAKKMTAQDLKDAEE